MINIVFLRCHQRLKVPLVDPQRLQMAEWAGCTRFSYLSILHYSQRGGAGQTTQSTGKVRKANRYILSTMTLLKAVPSGDNDLGKLISILLNIIL